MVKKNNNNKINVYSINLGIGEASSGVEYAQAYRYNALSSLVEEGSINQQYYIFLDFMPKRSVYDLCENIGIGSSSVLWLYDYFLGDRVSQGSLTKEDILKLVSSEKSQGTSSLNISSFEALTSTVGAIKLQVSGSSYLVAYPSDVNGSLGLYNRIEYVVGGYLVRKDYFSGKIKYASEYYAPRGGVAFCYKRDLFSLSPNLVGKEVVVFTELFPSSVKGADGNNAYNSKIFYYGTNGSSATRVFESKDLFFQYFFRSLGIKESDWVLLDRSESTGVVVFNEKRLIGFNLAVMVHAEHWTTWGTHNLEKGILWNNYYDYQFKNHSLVDAYISSTQSQSDTLESQLLSMYEGEYLGGKTVTIPVGYIDRVNENKGKELSFLTVSRLSEEKHIDILIKVVHGLIKKNPEFYQGLVFDIYGEGGLKAKLNDLIKELGLENNVRLLGHVDMKENNVYSNYKFYLSASTGEGFGLSLLEAVGSGCKVIGYNVPYGNTAFAYGSGGTLIPYDRFKELDDLENSTLQRYIDTLDSYFRGLAGKGEQNHVLPSSEGIANFYLKSNITSLWRNLFGGTEINE